MAPTTETVTDSTTNYSTVEGGIGTPGILNALTEGLTTVTEVWRKQSVTAPYTTPASSVLPSSEEQSTLQTPQVTDTWMTTVNGLAKLTSEALLKTTEESGSFSTQSVSTEHIRDKEEVLMLTTGLDDASTSMMTTEDPGFTLTPMLKWFIATGTIIGLVFILIIINCCLSYRSQLEKTVKDVKHAAAEEKRVRREQNQIHRDEDERTSNQTHVFLSWVRKGKQSPQQHGSQYSRC